MTSLPSPLPKSIIGGSDAAPPAPAVLAPAAPLPPVVMPPAPAAAPAAWPALAIIVGIVGASPLGAA
jgi:hypothetical protein